MKYWELSAPRKLALAEGNDAELPVGFAKVKLAVAGVTSSDYDVYRGVIQGVNYPIVLGRQGAGFISEVGVNDRGLERGQRVVINPRVVCGACYACKNNRPHECEAQKTFGVNLDGMVANFQIVPVKNIYPLPQAVKTEASLSLEPIAISNRIFAELDMPKGAHVAIFGATALGIVLAQVLLYHQAVPILVDGRQENLDIAAAQGVYYTVNSADADPVAQVRALSGGRMCEYAVYIAAGGEQASAAADAVMPGGTLAVTGYSEAGCQSKLSVGTIFQKQIRVIGITNGYKYAESAINLLARGDIDVGGIPVTECTFDSFPAAMQAFAKEANFLKKLLVKF
ncbi:MAG: alcohol dehydrogenase catalytic domain-containing protein [Clostridiales bacterium]|jgi:threonine dehydrogenase-like Zn-dependent dehydrogenase|nr:alcohol dehydrogenase catalytic domain-containing protein [Clostridiales bacterium]